MDLIDAHLWRKLWFVVVFNDPHLSYSSQLFCWIHLGKHHSSPQDQRWRQCVCFYFCERLPGKWFIHKSISEEKREIFTSLTFSFALLSDGCMTVPIIFAFPQTTKASSGVSVLIPTSPWHTRESGVCPFSQSTSLSFSNCPGFEALWR